VSLHTLDFVFGLRLLGLNQFDDIWVGKIWLVDFFGGWSIGYVLYDFIWLLSVYGANIPIMLHHCAEMLILTAYIYDPPLGSIYTLSGAVMMVSSALLHVQRISYLAHASPQTLQLIKYALLFTWIGGRLILAPRLMYLAVLNLPLNVLHVALLIACTGLFGMNSFWAYKIAIKKNLAF